MRRKESNAEMLIDAIMQKKPGLGDTRQCVELEKAGYVEFCGNQWNEDWQYKRSALRSLPKAFLPRIYEGDTLLMLNRPITTEKEG